VFPVDNGMPSIGFIVLTHRDEPQVLRLIDRLNALFDSPPIVCHHDFSQATFNRYRFPSNVRFVEPHVKTHWGTISLVIATLRALRLLYDTSAPGWFYLLSGADYPIQDGATIMRELAQSPYDAYIQLNQVDHTRVPERVQASEGGFEGISYTRLAYIRYIARSIPLPSWRHPHRGPAAPLYSISFILSAIHITATQVDSGLQQTPKRVLFCSHQKQSV
jgi:hypothetical protein